MAMTYTFDENRICSTFDMMNKHDEINLVWKGDDKIKGLCRGSKSGHGSTLFTKLEPTSYVDFYNKLNNYAQENKFKLRIYDRGLTDDEFIKLASEFKQNVEELNPAINFTLLNYADYITYVNVFQTFNGHMGEVLLVNYLKRIGYDDAHRANGELDSRYGIDILYNDDTIGVQVKSSAFFFGNKSSVINDRAMIQPLKEEVEEKFGIQMEYAIFDKKAKKYILNINGDVLFSFDEFMDMLKTPMNRYHPIIHLKRASL